MKLVEQFVANLDLIYYEDPISLLVFLNKIGEFEKLNKNPLISVTARCFQSREFSPCIPSQRLQNINLSNAYVELIEKFDDIPKECLGIVCQDIMDFLTTN